MTDVRIAEIEPTFFIRQQKSINLQKVVLTLNNPGQHAEVSLKADGESYGLQAPHGRSSHSILIHEKRQERTLRFSLLSEGAEVDSREVRVMPPRHWHVHVVQLSHHDLGYTNLPSKVLQEQASHLDQALDMIQASFDCPRDSQMRIVCEQAWSMKYYLESAPQSRAARLSHLLRSGHIELTALFGNMITELCSHESLIRALYAASSIRDKYGVSLVSAEHNDITGISWGLAEVLTTAGIKLFCPGLPLYYNWGNNFNSFWEQEVIFGRPGPGAFWWQSPSGKKLLFWCNNQGCGGPPFPKLPSLETYLTQLHEKQYPYSVIRFPVTGGGRDNSPYVSGFQQTIKSWNEQWTYPRLICSTNALFYNDFTQNMRSSLPVWAGELCGQDYPPGAMSTAKPTCINHRNHLGSVNAEKLATLSAVLTQTPYPGEEFQSINNLMLVYDEHTWGYHFPSGPAAEAAQLEKALPAYQAAASIHDLSNKAMAAIADRVTIDESALHLIVFNTEPRQRSGLVSHPLRELDNCGSTMRLIKGEEHKGDFLKGALLHDRYHVNPSEEIVNGKFELIDTETDQPVPFQIDELQPSSPFDFAGSRTGLSQGGRRYGMFEIPTGVNRELTFFAEDVPPMGYKAYRLVPKEEIPTFAIRLKHTERIIENDFYRIEADDKTGLLVSLLDKECGRELIDAEATHDFGSVIAKLPTSTEECTLRDLAVSTVCHGPVSTSLVREGCLPGHPRVTQTITLHQAIKRIDFASNILKDNTPLQIVRQAFPFHFKNPQIHYESTLSVIEPVTNYLPGSYSDYVAIQNWVQVGDAEHAVVWCSLDSPIVSLGGNWPGYVSPAHSCVIPSGLAHPPVKRADMKHGWIYSLLYCNNFGTNFAVNQPGQGLFRYAITSGDSSLRKTQAMRFSEDVANPFSQIYTQHHRDRTLPRRTSLFTIPQSTIVLLACKKRETGDEWVARVWNAGPDQEATLQFQNLQVNNATELTLTESPTSGSRLRFSKHQITLPINHFEVKTLSFTGVRT